MSGDKSEHFKDKSKGYWAKKMRGGKKHFFGVEKKIFWQEKKHFFGVEKSIFLAGKKAFFGGEKKHFLGVEKRIFLKVEKRVLNSKIKMKK